MSSIHTLFYKTFNKNTKLVLYWIILRVIPIGLALLYRYYSLALENIWGVFFFNIVNSFIRKKVYLLIYFEQYILMYKLPIVLGRNMQLKSLLLHNLFQILNCKSTEECCFRYRNAKIVNIVLFYYFHHCLPPASCCLYTGSFYSKLLRLLIKTV